MGKYALVNSSNVVINIAEWDGSTTWDKDPGTSQTIALNAGEACGIGFTYVSGGTPRFTFPTTNDAPVPVLDDSEYLVAASRTKMGSGRLTVNSTSVTVDTGKSGEVEFRRAALTGDVTASANSNSTTIASNAVTYAKMQDVSAASRLLGRGDSGSGDPQEITLGTGLTMTGTTLSAASGGSTVTINEQTYTANGTFTKSANCKYVIVEMVGGGGGGGNGTAGGAAGSGGCAGMFLETVIMAADLGTTTAVTVGSGGSAGINGSDTILTNNTTSTIIAQVQGGRAASNTTWSSVGIVALSGFGAGGGAGVTGRHGGNGPGGGGGGGTSSVGAAGGRPRSSLITSNVASGGGGAAGGTGGGAGSNATVTIRGYGEGGGGGAQSGGVGANGGNGIRGSGGGGGGAGATSGGTGGTGGDGFVRIIEVQVA